MQKRGVIYDALDEYNPFNGDKEKHHQPAVINITNTTETNEISKKPSSNLSEKNSSEDDKSSNNQKESTRLLDSPANNWPPFPKFCPIRPCFYLDFNADIPTAHKNLVKFSYYLWLAYSVAMVFNILGSLAYYITDNSMISASTFGTSIIFGILFPVFSFLLWFWPLYKAVRWDSSTNYFLFFIVMCGQIIIAGIQMMGINWLGSCGFINGLMMIRKDIVTGCIMFFIGVWFCILFTFFIILLFKVNYIYRHSSVSDVRMAESEFSNNLLNKSVSNREK